MALQLRRTKNDIVSDLKNVKYFSNTSNKGNSNLCAVFYTGKS